MTDHSEPPPSPSARWLVVGYGSTLHGDDALGPEIAEQVAAWRLPGVRALALPQLLPELAADLAAAEFAVFVDASTAGRTITLTRLQPAEADRPGLGHALTPAGLLALATAAYGRSPEAWLLAVPGERFELGQTLSARARLGAAESLAGLRNMLENAGLPKKGKSRLLAKVTRWPPQRSSSSTTSPSMSSC